MSGPVVICNVTKVPPPPSFFSFFSAHLLHWLDLVRVGSHLIAIDVILFKWVLTETQSAGTDKSVLRQR